MPGTPPNRLERACAATAAGAACAALIKVATELFAFGPLCVGAAVGFGILLAQSVNSSRRLALAAGLGGAGLLAGADPILRLAWGITGPGALPWIVVSALGIGVLVTLAVTPAAAPPGRAEGLAMALVATAGVTWGSRLTLALLVVALSGLLYTLRRGELPPKDSQSPSPPGGARSGAVARFGLVALALLCGLVGWSALRTAVDPSPTGALVVGVSCFVAAILPVPTIIRAAGVAAAVAALGWMVLAAPALPALPRDLALGLAGGATGLAVGGAGGARLTGFALLTAVGLLPAVLQALPPALPSWAARPRATLLGDTARADALEQIRSEATTETAHLGAAGAGVVYGLNRTFIATLDGTVVDPATRTGAAERFAGLLGACATNERARSRLAGDDLGLAALALHGQGFTSVISATPDRTLARAAADAAPGLARIWLTPALQLVGLPGSVVLRLGPTADVVVQIVRSPWSDARGSFPTAADFAAIRSTLAPAGVYVLALATPALDAPVVAEVLRTVVAAWPGATLWLPPAGADTLIVLAPAATTPLPWRGFEACATKDPGLLRALDLRDATDIAGHLYAGPDALRALPPGNAPRFGLPDAVAAGPPPIARLDLPPGAVAGVFDDAAPQAELTARHQTLVDFVGVLRSSGAGAVPEAVARTRALTAAPGGGTAAIPLIRPQLDHVRAAMARGVKEGVTSPAWEEAETALTGARLLAPDYPETRCVEGLLAERRGQLPRAATAYEACVAGAPEALEALDGLARVRRARGDLLGTEAALRQAYAARPDRWSTAHNLGVFLLTAGRYDEAERLLRTGAATQAREPTPDPAPHLALAQLYLDTRRPALTLAEAGRAFDTFPSAEAAYLKGAARYELGQYGEAEREFKDALRLNPDYYPARGGLGQVQAQQGEYAAAAASFKAVLARDPNNPSATENLARLKWLAAEAAP